LYSVAIGGEAAPLGKRIVSIRVANCFGFSGCSVAGSRESMEKWHKAVDSEMQIAQSESQPRLEVVLAIVGGLLDESLRVSCWSP
jgi:hypothetical protein